MNPFCVTTCWDNTTRRGRCGLACLHHSGTTVHSLARVFVSVFYDFWTYRSTNLQPTSFFPQPLFFSQSFSASPPPPPAVLNSIWAIIEFIDIYHNQFLARCIAPYRSLVSVLPHIYSPPSVCPSPPPPLPPHFFLSPSLHPSFWLFPLSDTMVVWGAYPCSIYLERLTEKMINSNLLD